MMMHTLPSPSCGRPRGNPLHVPLAEPYNAVHYSPYSRLWETRVMLPMEDGTPATDTVRPKDDPGPRGSWLPRLLDPARADGVPDWVRGLTKTQAEDLLDWLEAHGVAGEVMYEDDIGFAVRPVVK